MCGATNGLRPYKVSVSPDDLVDLERRLAGARLPDVLPDAGWRDGMDPTRLRLLVGRWRDGYDWREQERWINRFPQVIARIDGTEVHALDVRSPVARSDRPAIVLLHGWPSSVFEFRKIIGPLTTGRDGDVPAFDVVVPSLPGFGFSGPTTERGWNADRMADAIDEMMRRLGHDHYLAHGGDAGYAVATSLGERHPDRVLGLHLNLGGVAITGEHRAEKPCDDHQRRAFDAFDRYLADGSAYALVHATRPQTISYALTDSAVGQLAWIAEKFQAWADPDLPIDDDDILTAASVYWHTRTAGSSARFYQEHYGKYSPPTKVNPTPTRIAAFPREIVPPVRAWAEQKYTIHSWIDMPRGGHFPSLETPDLIVDSLRSFACEVA